MIKYLKQEEKIESRPLWEKVFSEDSQSFVDYYYSDRVRKNKVLTAWKDGRLTAMLHRNPYEVAVKERLWRTDYIAGVATDPDFRHQGYMRSLLSHCFSDMYMERMGFCFLVPVDPAIYTPFDFTYICSLPQRVLNKNGISGLSRRALVEEPAQCRAAAEFAGRQLEKEYEVYALRDEGYYRDLCREVRSDRGDLILLYTKEEKEQLAGVLAYYGESEQSQRELICLPGYSMETGPEKPAAMGRIVHLEQFVSVICLEENCPVEKMEVVLEVKDDFIHHNCGLFRWILGKDGSRLVRMGNGAEEAAAHTDEGSAGELFGLPRLSLGIGELTAWLFGRGLPSVPEEFKEPAAWIRPLRGVFFDEIT